MRETGKIEAHVVKTDPDAVENTQRGCVSTFGPGVFSHTLETDGSVTWRYDYAEKVGTGNHDAPLIDAEFVDAVQLARVNLCNMGAVKMANDGIYEPVDPADENAVQKCTAINRLEEFLKQYGKQTRR